MPKKRSNPLRKSPKQAARKAPAPAKPAPRLSFPVYHVDAFTKRIFHGNPAAVVLLDGKWPADDLLQSIAVEQNMPMTAIVLRTKNKNIGLRWFNPLKEFNLCGHATLAAAHVLWNHEKLKGNSLTFTTLGGELHLSRDQDLIAMQLQARPAVRVRASNALCAALGRQPSEVYQADMTLAVFENKRDVHALAPDFARIAALDTSGVIVTAPGAGHDFVSRYFAPKHGLNEDHATGSSHCTLVPYWSNRLRKQHLTAHQVSPRAGELWCELRGDRVLLGGHAVTFSHGTITM